MKTLFHRLKLSGLLSFGPDGVDLPMQRLSVLIGPNGSGKSNLPGGGLVAPGGAARHLGADLAQRRRSGMDMERGGSA